MSYPQGIVAGPDGALWFAAWNTNTIGRITTADNVTAMPIRTADSGAEGIVAGPDGALWFTEAAANKIGRITTDGQITETRVPTSNRDGPGPGDIAVGADGALWFTEYQANRIGRITTAGTITEFASPVIRGFRLTDKMFAAGRQSTPRVGAPAAKRHTNGVTFDYTLDKTVTVSLVIAERRTGRREGKTCVTTTKRLFTATKCVRAIVRGTLTRKSRRGMNHVAFSGRIGSTALKPGSYQAALTATDLHDNTSTNDERVLRRLASALVQRETPTGSPGSCTLEANLESPPAIGGIWRGNVQNDHAVSFGRCRVCDRCL